MGNWEIGNKQYEALRWIAAGCPSRDDFRSLQASTALLQARRLITVRRQPWRAELADEGRAVLRLQTLARSTSPDRENSSTESPPPAIPDLLSEVQAAGGTLVIVQPSKADRHIYLGAFQRLIRAGAMPDGQRLRHRGRESGDLVFWLEADDPAERKVQGRTELPERIDHPHQLFARRIRSAQAHHRPLDRKLVLAHVLATEFENRGFTVSGRETEFTLTTEDQIAITFQITDQTDKVPELGRDGRQKTDSWGAPRWVHVANGKVQVTTSSPYHRRSWADRSRWSIADKVPEIIAHAESEVAEERSRRAADEQRRKDRFAQWEAAVPRAVEKHKRAWNRGRATKQIEAWHRAVTWRNYADAVTRAAQQLSDTEQADALAWAAWLNDEAGKVDPTNDAANLVIETPRPHPWELSEFMPFHWSVSQPPD